MYTHMCIYAITWLLPLPPRALARLLYKRWQQQQQHLSGQLLPPLLLLLTTTTTTTAKNTCAARVSVCVCRRWLISWWMFFATAAAVVLALHRAVGFLFGAVFRRRRCCCFFVQLDEYTVWLQFGVKATDGAFGNSRPTQPGTDVCTQVRLLVFLPTATAPWPPGVNSSRMLTDVCYQ